MEPYYCDRSTKIGKILDHFKQGYTHMAIVCDDPKWITEQAHKIMMMIRKDKEEEKKNLE